MSVIINDNGDTFTLSGISYFKNFTPIVRGQSISVVNTYDSRLVLVEPTLFSEITVDGSTFGNVRDCQLALLPIIYIRPNGTSIINNVDSSFSFLSKQVAFKSASYVNYDAMSVGLVFATETNGNISSLIFDTEYSNLLLKDKSLLESGKTVHLKYHNKTQGVTFYAEVSSFELVQSGTLIKANFSNDILTSELNVNDVLQCFLPDVNSDNSTVWLFIEGSEVRKKIGNENLEVLEDGDTVRNKDITNNGFPLHILIADYDASLDAGDKQSEISYVVPQLLTN